jgi:hypothetical protein
MGDMWIVCWPRRWMSEDGSREGGRKGRKGAGRRWVSGWRREERVYCGGVDGRSWCAA